ncbi:MAG: Gfo/Idh/MocA family oxidoreductase [Planctomycetota bacterium]
METPSEIRIPAVHVPEDRLKVAVLGGGHLGRIHAKLLAGRSDVEVIAVCDPYAPSREWVASNLHLATYETYEPLANQIDAAVIATPTTMHFEVAHWCLTQGIHCLIEKPIASTAVEAEELIRVARMRGCTLQVGHVERFNPVWRALCDQVDPQHIRHIASCREGVYTGRSTDIGIVLDLMIHDIDLILSLVDSPVRSIFATGRCVLGSHEDFAIADLVFRNGVTAHLRASRISPSPERSMEVHCDDDWYALDFSNQSIVTTRPSEAVANGELQADSMPIEQRMKVKDELFTRWLERVETRPASANAIELEHQDWIDSIRSGHEPRVSGIDAAKALQVACAITEQIAEQMSLHGGIIPAARLAAARRRAG